MGDIYLFSGHFYFKEFCFSTEDLPRCVYTDKTNSLALVLKHKKRGKMYLNILEYNVVLISQAVSSNKIIQQ